MAILLCAILFLVVLPYKCMFGFRGRRQADKHCSATAPCILRNAAPVRFDPGEVKTVACGQSLDLPFGQIGLALPYTPSPADACDTLEGKLEAAASHVESLATFIDADTTDSRSMRNSPAPDVSLRVRNLGLASYTLPEGVPLARVVVLKEAGIAVAIGSLGGAAESITPVIDDPTDDDEENEKEAKQAQTDAAAPPDEEAEPQMH